jgi:hypothetical protein
VIKLQRQVEELYCQLTSMKKKNMKDHEKCINHESMINFESVREINFLIRMNMMLKLESIFLMILVFFYGLKSNTKIQ